MKTFGCTKYALDGTRKMKVIFPGIAAPEKNKHLCSSIDTKQTEHFITYLFSNCIVSSRVEPPPPTPFFQRETPSF